MEFEEWLNGTNWDNLNGQISPSEQVEILQTTLTSKMNEVFPEKKVKLSSNDKPYMTAELKQIDRLKQREYWRIGKSVRYNSLKKMFSEKSKVAGAKYVSKNISDIKSSNPSRASLKNLAAHPGESQDSTFTLPQHLDQNFSAKQSAELISNHFSNISQRFPPLSFDLLPERVQAVISTPLDMSELPTVSEYDVFCKIASAKKSKSTIPGDLPKRLLQQLPAQLAKPATTIFNNITRSGEWASQYKIEYVTPVAKVKVPETEDDLRNISLTTLFQQGV